MLKPKYTFENLGETDPIKSTLDIEKKERELPDIDLPIDEAEANLLSDLSKEMDRMDKLPKNNNSDEKLEPISYRKGKLF